MAMAMLLSSCGVKRCIPEGRLLLKQNSITLVETESTPFRPNRDELSAQILHRPNKRVLCPRI